MRLGSKNIFNHFSGCCIYVSMILSLSGCNETLEPDYSHFGYDFFPLQIGQYQIYKVRAISFSLLSEPDTSDYELKVYVSDSVRDNAGETSYILHRLKRENSEVPWMLDSLWYSYRNSTRATIFENNLPVIKLVFPFLENKSWDANSMNSRNPDDFEMREVFMPYSNIFEEYQNTVTIFQEEKLDSIISLDYRYEIYAQNVGLIEKFSSNLDFCQVDECRGHKIIEEGRIYSQVLIENGTE